MRLLANNVYCYNNLELHCHTWDMLQYPSGGYCTFRRFTELQVPYSVCPENNYSPLWWDFLVEPPIQQTWNFFLIKVNKFLSNLWLLHATPPPPPPPPTEFSKTLHIWWYGYFQGPHISNNNCLRTMQQNHLAETLLILKSSFVLQDHSIISSLSTQAQGWTLHPPYFLLVQTAPVHHPESDICEMKRSQQTTARIAGRKPA